MSPSPPAIRSVKARAVDRADLAAGEERLRRHPLGAAGADRCRDRSGRHRTLLHLCLHQADAEAAGAADRRDRRANLTGKAIAPFDLMAQMDAKFRLLGWQGLVGMAVSGLDMAFWDALGQAAGQPLATLLGGSPRPIRAYDSYGAVDPVADEKDLRRSLDQGFRGIKIKGGDGDLANDERVVKAVRDLIGPDIALMLDFNQSLDPSEASRRIDRLAAYDLHWIEEPVAAENLQGHAKVRATSPISIQSGENWWFPRGFAEAIAAGASDFIMPDLMKVGGVTGWLRVAGQAEAASIPMSSHLFAEASSHMLAVTPTAHWLEVSRSRPRRSSPSRSRSSTARSPPADMASGCPGTKRRSRNIWCERAATARSIVDAELVIETPEHRGQHLRQIFRDQAGPGLARGLAMHPDPDARRPRTPARPAPAGPRSFPPARRRRPRSRARAARWRRWWRVRPATPPPYPAP